MQPGIQNSLQLWKMLFLAGVLIFSLGAACSSIDGAIYDYEKVKETVSLGDSKDKVLSILNPTLKSLSKKHKKDPEKYLEDKVLVEVYFFRSKRVADDLTTDDEFTPYIFKNGKLAGIGWTMIGGAKSHGQAESGPVVCNRVGNTMICN